MNTLLLSGLLLGTTAVIITAAVILCRVKNQISRVQKGRIWGIIALVSVLLVSNIGVTGAAFSDREQSTGNSIQIKTNWYNLSWHYRKQIVINHAMVSAANQTNFTVLVSRIDPVWAVTGSGGHTGKANGGDFVFTSSDGLTKLNHEVEKYVSTTGELVAWVMISNLSSTVDTVLYVYYGNATCADQWAPSAAWDINTKGVWHLRENPAGVAPQILDSTANGNNGTTSGTMTASEQVVGKIDGSLDFDGSNDYVSIADSNSLSIGTTVTLSAWIYPHSVSGTQEIISKWTPTTILGLYGNNQEYQLYLSGNEIGVGALCGTGTTTGANVTINTWYHIEMVWIGGSTVNVYKNGVLLQTVTLGLYPLFQGNGTSAALNLASYNSGNYFNGIIDEPHVAMSIRDANWIRTEYNNQNSSATYFTFGAEE